MQPKQIFPGVYRIDGRLATASLAPGFKVYDEQEIRVGAGVYRTWNPSKSKLGAAIAKGVKHMPIAPGASVLYLGAASGTTPSHVSDIVGADGLVFCVEFAPRAMRDLVAVCEARPNMLPLLKDARNPKEYAQVVLEENGGRPVDVLFEDVADPEQARILVANAGALLKRGGLAMLAVKAKSIDAVADTRQVFAKVERELAASGLQILENISLEPYEHDHVMLVVQKPV